MDVFILVLLPSLLAVIISYKLLAQHEKELHSWQVRAFSDLRIEIAEKLLFDSQNNPSNNNSRHLTSEQLKKIGLTDSEIKIYYIRKTELFSPILEDRFRPIPVLDPGNTAISVFFLVNSWGVLIVWWLKVFKDVSILSS
jgi:hypothetical protein